MQSPKRILITGGAGFLGSHLCERLLADGHDVLIPSGAGTAAGFPDEAYRAAGAEVFRLSCTRCHTVSGVNSVIDRLDALYGSGDWDRDTIKYSFEGMHTTRPYMPPFPGTDHEAGALADYLVDLQRVRRPVLGAQDVGVDPARGPGATATGREES